MKLINYINDNRACLLAESKEIADYLENMSEVQQIIVDAYPGKPSKSINDYLLKRDIILDNGTTLKNAWCCSIRTLGDEEAEEQPEEPETYEIEVIFDSEKNN